MGVRFFACVRFVVEDVNVSVADLQEVDVTDDNVAFEVQVESAAAVCESRRVILFMGDRRVKLGGIR